MAGVLLGLTVGLGLYTFVYARGYAYLTNGPQACTDCHVMEESLRWVDQVRSPLGSCLQRLPHPSQLFR
jgi:cytochrome c nitrite reductase small subunit